MTAVDSERALIMTLLVFLLIFKSLKLVINIKIYFKTFTGDSYPLIFYS